MEEEGEHPEEEEKDLKVEGEDLTEEEEEEDLREEEEDSKEGEEEEDQREEEEASVAEEGDPDKEAIGEGIEMVCSNPILNDCNIIGLLCMEHFYCDCEGWFHS